MRKKLIGFLKNDLAFWIFFIFLCITMILFVLKKEGVKITIDFGEAYGNRIFTFGN